MKKCELTLFHFQKEKHDSFIDFIKAYGIICILLAHALPDDMRLTILFPIWGGMSVPLFFLLQCFHVLKRNKYRLNVKKLVIRIIIPFFITQIPIFIIWCFAYNKTFDWLLIKQTLKDGGKGPGSYFIWVYLQFALLLPFIHRFVNKRSLIKLLLISVLLCVIIDIIVSIVDMPQWLYRLLFVRYFFLAFLAVLWVKEGVVINIKNIVFSIVGFIATLFFMFSDIDLEPVFFQTVWNTHRWICYFYVSGVTTWGLWCCYKLCYKSVFLKRIFTILAKNTYEIYLVQMGVFLFAPLICSVILGDNNPFSLCGILLCLGLSIWGGIILRNYYDWTLKKIKL